jgi:hypothetical protein
MTHCNPSKQLKLPWLLLVVRLCRCQERARKNFQGKNRNERLLAQSGGESVGAAGMPDNLDCTVVSVLPGQCMLLSVGCLGACRVVG